MSAATAFDQPVAVVGAGLTGMTAAYALHERGVPVRVLEGDAVLGGASRTVLFKGFRFDLGGHRFYTRNAEVIALVRKLIGDDLLTVPRQSRIYLRGKLVDYPLSFFNALGALGPMTSTAVALSYAWEKAKGCVRVRPEATFEDWVVRRFGRRLYEIYFRPYSEKVWGTPCGELTADFAAQRIKGMSFRAAVKSMFARKSDAPASLVSEFLYPRLGFGRIPETMAEALPQGALQCASPVLRVVHDGARIRALEYRQGREMRSLAPRQVISTIPVTDWIRMLQPAAPDVVQEAAAGLRYRDMVIVFLTLRREQVTPDQWIYFSTDDVFFGRMHEPKNWSKAMAPDGCTSLVVEIFCYETDPVFTESNDSITRRVVKRLAEMNFIRAEEATDAVVVHLKKAYPLYVGDFQERLDTVFCYLKRFENLQMAGRNGLFRYTSGDHYMDMGLKAAENVLGANHDLNAVGSAKEYAEK